MVAAGFIRALSYLQKNPTQNMYAREMVGDVLPHIAIARTADERIDTSVIQLTNTLGPVAGGYGLSKLYDLIQNKVQPLKTQVAKNWYHFGKSMALLGFVASIPIANAFIRNWVTVKRSGKTGFIDMVGEKDTKLSGAEKKQKAHKKLKEYGQNIGKILGVGAVVSAGLFGLTQLAIKKQWKFGKAVSKLHNYIGLPQGKFENFASPAKEPFGFVQLPTILFWGLPIYAGLFSASRDEFEFKELVLRFLTFITAFFLGPKLIRKQIEKHFEKKTPKALEKVFGNNKNVGMIAELITTSILFAVLPPLVNIVLTRNRVKKEQAKQIEQPAFDLGSLHHKPNAFMVFEKSNQAA